MFSGLWADDFAWRFESGSNLPLIRPDSKRLRIGGDPRALSKELLVRECLPALWTARTTFSAGPRLPTNRSSPPHSSMILNSAIETHTSENDFEMSGSPDGCVALGIEVGTGLRMDQQV